MLTFASGFPYICNPLSKTKTHLSEVLFYRQMFFHILIQTVINRLLNELRLGLDLKSVYV